MDDLEGVSVLHLLARMNDRALINWVCQDVKVDVNIRGWKGNTPLHEAVLFVALDSVSLLLELGADVNCRGEGGRTRVYQYAIVSETD